MRDLHKTLQLFAKDFAMDYCEEFDDVKTILEYCNRHVKPFNKIHFRGGNEAYINDMVRRLQDVFVMRGMLLLKKQKDAKDKYEINPKKLQIMRKIMLFLFANTDCTYKYNLRDDPYIAHILEICPLLPKFLLLHLVWNLRMDVVFIEALCYMPIWFSFQYFDAAAESMKYINDPYEVLDKVHHLVNGILINLTRCEQREIDNVDKRILFTKMHDCTMNLLRQFYTPDSEKFKQFKRNQFYRYTGFALRHLLEMVMMAFDLCEDSTKAEPDIDTEIYDVCLQLCKKKKPTPKQLSKELKELQTKLTGVLLNSLQYNVMQVKLDVFMYWVEVDIENNQTLQEKVGEIAYHVMERMQANPRFGHEVEQQLKFIAIRPKTMEQRLKEANIGDILRTLDEEMPRHDKKRWFDELMQRTVALGNEECLFALRTHLELLDAQNCKDILDYIVGKINLLQAENSNEAASVAAELETEDEEESDSAMELDVNELDELKRILLLSLNQLKLSDIVQLLEYQVKLFGELNSVFRLGSEYERKVNNFFNKFIDEFDMIKFASLCFEHPFNVWSKFFDVACENELHTGNFAKAVKQMRPFSNFYCNQLLVDALQDEHKLQQKAFPQLLCDIFFTLYYPDQCNEFLKHYISDNVLSYIDGEQYESLLPIVLALNKIAAFKVEEEKTALKSNFLNFGERTAPVLLLVAKILDNARWDLKSYTDERDQLVTECIQFITKTSNSFLPVATKKDRVWITKCVSSYSVTTKFYFQRFDLTQEQTPLDFDRYLEIENKEEPLMFLVNNFTRCTFKEAKWLAQSERLLPHISEMLIMFGEFVEKNKTDQTVNNYRHCLASYINILNSLLIPKLENDSKKLEKLILKLFKIINASPADVYEETFMNFENLLLDITKRLDKPLNEQSVQMLLKFVNAMKDCKAKSIYMENLANLADRKEKETEVMSETPSD